jgi:hypothetical protein
MNQDKKVTTSIRIPKDLHQQLRTIAFEKRVSIHALLLEGAAGAASRHLETLQGSSSKEAA